ncbi:hypothetical protein GCM10018781_30570 [Kitasatospora indigofera]|uniref:Uncharacterized protein n=1 Tax=Kitasatospora indigofera TaxID=67307 RepID=A0A919FRC2_9ACTN|nr:hypothetical protein GCM10018781_30570 [Kitasatospora indigofera]
MSFSAFGWFGWAPVSAVEPSPIGVPFTGPPPGVPGLPPPAVVAPPEPVPGPASDPGPDPPEQAVTAPSAAVATVALSMVLREMPVMVSPAARCPAWHGEAQENVLRAAPSDGSAGASAGQLAAPVI